MWQGFRRGSHVWRWRGYCYRLFNSSTSPFYSVENLQKKITILWLPVTLNRLLYHSALATFLLLLVFTQVKTCPICDWWEFSDSVFSASFYLKYECLFNIELFKSYLTPIKIMQKHTSLNYFLSLIAQVLPTNHYLSLFKFWVDSSWFLDHLYTTSIIFF